MYCKHANEQKAFKLDVRTVNDYIAQIFGKNEPKDPHDTKSFATVEGCQSDFNSKINNIYLIRDARNSLRRKTGKKEFSMSEIIDEIKIRNKSNKYKIIEPDSKRK